MISSRVTPLGRKILAAILGTTFIALVLSFVLNLLPMIYAYRQDVTDKASAMADLLATSMVAPIDFEDPVAAQESLETLSLVPDVFGAAVYVGEHGVFASYKDAPNLPELKDMVTTDGLSGLVITAPIPAEHSDCYLVIRGSLDGQWALLQRYVLTNLAVLVAVFVVCYKLAGLFRKRLGDPIAELTDVVHDISQEKDYSRRVRHESNDEVGMLVAEFNAMLERVEYRDNQLERHRELLEDRVEERTMQLRRKQLELLKNNRLLMSEIKKRAQAEMIREEVERINRHDLKSSLSLIIGYPELLLSEGNLSPEQEKMVRRIRAAGYRMLDMIRNHLNMFKMENGIYKLNTTSVDLVELLCALEEEFAPALSTNHVKLSMQLDDKELVGDETCVITGDGQLLRAMLRNLIQNAMEASVPGDLVSVSLSHERGLRIAIANNAVVPEKIRRRFFDKYVTHGKENGTGLGTYIAALIARTHGADITMRTDVDSGTVITVAMKADVPADDAISASVGL